MCELFFCKVPPALLWIIYLPLNQPSRRNVTSGYKGSEKFLMN